MQTHNVINKKPKTEVLRSDSLLDPSANNFEPYLLNLFACLFDDRHETKGELQYNTHARACAHTTDQPKHPSVRDWPLTSL